MSPGLDCEGVGLVCFPRMSGDEPLSPGLATLRAWFSPHERG